MPAPVDTLWTIGHSTRLWEEFISILQDAGIERLVDVRRFPGSRHNPQYGGDVLAPALAKEGIDYCALSGLGGRRTPRADSVNLGWRVAAFRGYADHLGSAEYRQARAELVTIARQRRSCVMCAEAVWWRCHRRLIADDFSVRGWTAIHLMEQGKATPHTLRAGAVLVDDVLRYPQQA